MNVNREREYTYYGELFVMIKTILHASVSGLSTSFA